MSDVSSLRNQSRHRSHRLGCLRLHPHHPPNLQAMARRMGSPHLHDRHRNHSRRQQHDIPRPLPRHCHRRHLRPHRLAPQRRRRLPPRLLLLDHVPVQLLPRLRDKERPAGAHDAANLERVGPLRLQPRARALRRRPGRPRRGLEAAYL